MKNLLFKIGRLLSLFIYIETIYVKFRNCIYNGYISSKFSKFGKSRISKGAILHNPKNIAIGDSCFFGKNCILTTWGEGKQLKLIIGNNCNIGEYNHITAFNEINIGDNVLTGRWVTISDNSHGESNITDMQIPPIQRKIYSKGSVIIEDDVWIGDKVSILAGVRIGKGSIIGANSVVTKDIPPYSIAVGIPAKIAKKNI